MHFLRERFAERNGTHCTLEALCVATMCNWQKVSLFFLKIELLERFKSVLLERQSKTRRAKCPLRCRRVAVNRIRCKTTFGKE